MIPSKRIIALQHNRRPSAPKSQPRKRRFRPGQNALRQIVKFQNSTQPILSRLGFYRLVKDVSVEITEPDKHYKWTKESLHVLQLASQDYIVGLLQDAYLCTLHAKRVTIGSKDLMLARRIRGINDPANR